MGKAKVMCLDGEYWFSQRYAAELLGTTPGKIKVMVIRSLIDAHPQMGADWLSERSVTRIRRDPDLLKSLKAKAKEPRASRPPEVGSMPQVGPDQHVLPIADYRLPLTRGARFKP